MNEDTGQSQRKILSNEQRYSLISQVIYSVTSIIRLIIFGILVILIAYWTKDVLLAYAGKSTAADVAIRFFAEFKIDRALAYLFGLGGIGYGWQQRELRRRTIKRLTERTGELERKIDPNRSSSGLTERGTTHLRDR